MINNGYLINNRYEVVEPIGEGGMSNVYRAKDHVLGRYVAIKVLKNEFAQDANFVVKFRAEAQSAAGLEHPNIVNIYDVGCQQGQHYIVMECVEGITLKTYIEKKGQLSFKEALSIAIQVGRGIQAAHGKGIIHRDIKPQNVIISTEGKVKVTDFGIARMASANTINAEVMGSVHYASPEQARNGYVTHTSDIYSLGIVMYEMVTGRVPFDGDSMVSVAIQHLQEEMVAPSTYAPNLPISMEKIILKCTQKNPDRRYASMDELLADLRQSLLTPDADFVVLAPLVQGQTRVISRDELETIQQHSSGIVADDDDDEYDDDEYDDDEYDDDDDEGGRFLNKKMEKAVTIMGIVAAIVIVILVVYLAGSFLGVFNFGKIGKDKNPAGNSTVSEQQAEQVEMIDITGMTFDEAQTELQDMGLKLVQGGTEESKDYEPGEIISQDVKKGDMVEAGTKVTVIVCASAEEADVPDVVGKESDIAKDILEDAGFSVSREYEYSADVETGMVISQTPESGKSLHKGDTVTIYISQGTEKAKVPNVVGKTESEAKSALTSAGFVVGNVTQEASDTVAAGNVIKQSVKADSYLEKGKTVDLVISKGKVQLYKFEYKITAPTDGYEIVSAYVELNVDGQDEAIETWTFDNPSNITIQKSDLPYSEGYITITWYYVDSEDGQTKPSAPQEIYKQFDKQ